MTPELRFRALGGASLEELCWNAIAIANSLGRAPTVSELAAQIFGDFGHGPSTRQVDEVRTVIERLMQAGRVEARRQEGEPDVRAP
jgi:hypothetical protein